MTSDPIREALSRLAQALDRLDAVSVRHAEAERARATLETELALMREDRHELARQLDGERALREDCQAALATLEPRLDRAAETLRHALAGK
jgi:predicted  nucleic acid-binding Zn-ribbon protein